VAEIAPRGWPARAVAGDVVDPATATALVSAAAELGQLAVWVNNAGVSVLAPLIDTTSDEMAHMVDVNVMGTFHGTRAAAAAMIAAGSGGRIVNIASEAGVQAFPLLGAYSATKFAVVGLTQAAAIELGIHGITVNAICPGTAETDMVLAEREREVAISGRSPDEVRGSYLDGIPLGRFCEPDDVGALVAFVAGPGGAYVTGQSLCTNGGSVLH
jgi:NAD(P)-dependent dehydrogenase (short-subunit alcohol dehydrogenase family)